MLWLIVSWKRYVPIIVPSNVLQSAVCVFDMFLSNCGSQPIGVSCDENSTIVIHYSLTGKSMDREFATVDQMKLYNVNITVDVCAIY